MNVSVRLNPLENLLAGADAYSPSKRFEHLIGKVCDNCIGCDQCTSAAGPVEHHVAQTHDREDGIPQSPVSTWAFNHSRADGIRIVRGGFHVDVTPVGRIVLNMPNARLQNAAKVTEGIKHALDRDAGRFAFIVTAEKNLKAHVHSPRKPQGTASVYLFASAVQLLEVRS